MPEGDAAACPEREVFAQAVVLDDELGKSNCVSASGRSGIADGERLILRAADVALEQTG